MAWQGVALAALWLLGMVVAGCAAPGDPRGLGDRPTDVVDTPAFETVDGLSLLALSPRAGVVRVVEGDHAGGELAFTLTQQGDHWVREVAGRQRAYLRMTADGDVVIDREEDEVEQVRVEYEPGIMLMPAQLGPDTVRAGEVRMVVYRLGDGQERERGTCVYEVRSLGRGPITIAGTELDGYILRQTRQINLRLAKVAVQIDTAYVQGEGLVAQSVDRRLRALGFFGSRTYERLERVE